MAKEPSFEAQSDAAVDKFFEALVSAPDVEETIASVAADDTDPASKGAGTTLANDDGSKPDAVAADGQDKTVVEDKTTTPAKTDDGFDPEKTLSKYKTPEDLQKAVVEKDRELLKRADQKKAVEEENARLKTELETLKGGKPTPEAPKDQKTEPEKVERVEAVDPRSPEFQAQHTDWLKRVHTAKPEELTAEERTVKNAIAVLDADNKAVTQAGSKVKELDTKESELSTTMARLKTIIEDQEEAFKANPEDFNLEKRLQENQAKLDKLDRDHARTVALRTDAIVKYTAAKGEFESKMVQVDDYAKRAHLGQRQKTYETATQQEASKASTKEWDDSERRLFSEHLKSDKFSDRVQKHIKTALGRALYEYKETTGKVPDDFYAWMVEQKDIYEDFRAIGQAAQQALLDDKESDLPKKPADNIVKDTKPGSGGKPKSFEKHMRDRGSVLDKALGF